MAEKYNLHSETPHVKRIYEIADQIKQGHVALFPTDSQYALGCAYDNKKGIERIRQIRQLEQKRHLTLMLDSLSHISKFAYLSDENFKIIKRLIPGPFTFILPATKEVPKLLVHPSKETIGVRVPDYPITEKLIKEIGNPMLAITAKKKEIPDEEIKEMDRDTLLRHFEKQVDLIIDDKRENNRNESTVIDMTNNHAVILRRGLRVEDAEEVFDLNGVSYENA